MNRGSAALVAVAGLAIGCAGQIRLGETGDPEYDKVLGEWSQHGKIFDGIDELVRWAGTFKSPEFRDAYARRRAVVLGLSPTDYQALVASERAEGQKEVAFALGMFTENTRANDLDSSHSIWRVALFGPEGVERSDPIIKRTHPPNADQILFYPYLEPSWVFYSIRFPAVDPQGQPLFAIRPGTWTLRVASALGMVELSFPLRAP